jgi:hypothetical protein
MREESMSCNGQITVETMAARLGVRLPDEMPKEVLSVLVSVNPRYRRKLGYCSWRRDLTTGEIVFVRIQLHPLLESEPELLEVTFRHEVAHAWAVYAGHHDAGHGPIWKHYARLMGLHNPSAFNGTEAAHRVGQHHCKTVATCTKCGYEIKRVRAWTARRPHRHIKCGGLIQKVA